eukprot:Amastigsp_a509073_333.p3 type:complete len:182 gc:universal Amastigsp_a509073_333:831-286(-)
MLFAAVPTETFDVAGSLLYDGFLGRAANCVLRVENDDAEVSVRPRFLSPSRGSLIDHRSSSSSPPFLLPQITQQAPTRPTSSKRATAHATISMIKRFFFRRRSSVALHPGTAHAVMFAHCAHGASGTSKPQQLCSFWNLTRTDEPESSQVVSIKLSSLACCVNAMSTIETCAANTISRSTK